MVVALVIAASALVALVGFILTYFVFRPLIAVLMLFVGLMSL